tara:strand:- start:13143 stop:13604 length:462 start_codon:yes stop_codon:yes gene_type:complete
MVPGEHQDVLGPRFSQQFQVLIHGVRGTGVPTLARPLLRRDHVHVFAKVGREEAPPALDVANQALRLVLRENSDVADTRVHAVAQRKVDDLELPPERHGRLCTPVGKLPESRTAPARQDERQRALGQVVGPALGECALRGLDLPHPVNPRVGS